MNRSRQIVLVSHCLLNANSRVEGLSRYPGVHPIVGALSERGCGLIQLPCPELALDGLQRPPRAIEQYDTDEYRSLCARLAEDVVGTVELYERSGMHVIAVLGVEGSPSCGVHITNTAQGAGSDAVSVRTSGSGVFVQELKAGLEPRGVRFEAVDAHEDDFGVSSALRALGWDD